MVEPDPGHEPIPLDVLLDSEPDAEDEWEVVPVEDADIDAELPEDVPQPKHSVRSDTPGARGCWARAKSGDPCGAAKLRDGDYCAAHSGVGLSSDPAAYAPQGNEASRRARAAQARLRLELGITRPNSPRGHLKARVFAERERLAAVAVNGALDDPRLALRLIEVADPAPVAELSVSANLSVEDVESMSMSQLYAVAEKLGIETQSSGSPTP